MKIRWLVALCALFLPSIASADVTPVTSDRLVLNGGFGAGGTAELTITPTGVPATSTAHDGRKGGIAGVQYEWAAFDYFVLAGRFGVNRADWADDNSRHRTWLDFDAIPMFTFGIDVGPLVLEPRVGVPIGLGMLVWNAQDDLTALDGIKRTNFAWNVGGLGGALVRFREGSDFVRSLGLTLEMGYMRHAAMATGQYSHWDYALTHSQFVMQFGVAIALP